MKGCRISPWVDSTTSKIPSWSLSLIPQYKTVLSWDFLACFLAWILVKDRIPLSFTNFITTPELSGLLYMSPDNYHTHILWSQFIYAITLGGLFLLASNILLIVILLDPPHLTFTITFSFRTGVSGNTFLVLFQLKWFYIYSDQFVRNVLHMIPPENWCVIHWKLLLSGFRSVSVHPLRLKIRFVFRVLVPSDRATCTIAFRANFFYTKKLLFLNFDFEVSKQNMQSLTQVGTTERAKQLWNDLSKFHTKHEHDRQVQFDHGAECAWMKCVLPIARSIRNSLIIQHYRQEQDHFCMLACFMPTWSSFSWNVNHLHDFVRETAVTNGRMSVVSAPYLSPKLNVD